MKISTLAWCAAIVVMAYYLTTLGWAYHQAMTVYFDVKHSKAASVLYGK